MSKELETLNKDFEVLTKRVNAGGGTAFPASIGSATEIASYPGMTLRDWFAGQAVTNLANSCSHYADAARHAYGVADAMLKARQS